MKYRVKTRNAKECRTILNFPDLCVKYSNGYAPSLKVNEGDEIPLNVCDPEDVRKSWIVGSLKGYTESGWIEEIKEQEEVTPILPVVQSTSQFVTEQDIKVSTPPQDVPPILQEADKSVAVVQNEPITDLTKVVSYDDFCKLSHFLRLRFIKENNNIDLLKQIASSTPSAQLKNNIQLRLTQLPV